MVPGSGLAFLSLESESGCELFVPGDWRMIQNIAQDLEGIEVEIVDTDDGEIIRPVSALDQLQAVE